MRAAVVLCLVVVLPVLAFEEGIHSAHHLPDYGHPTTCTLAACSTHTAATPAERIIAWRPILRALDRAPEWPQPAVPWRPVPANRGRAPPAISP
jgi:hypothetical protein